MLSKYHFFASFASIDLQNTFFYYILIYDYIMRNIFLITVSILMFFSACGTSGEEAHKDTTDSATKNAPLKVQSGERLCFQLDFKKDISELKLNIEGDKVTGELNILPFEKDAAIGTLVGTKKDNMIYAEWNYIIEGNKQIEEVEFKLEGDKAFQRLGEFEDKNGKLMLKPTTEKILYSDPMLKVDCK